ncbi:MAG TPA: L,D-transpeptidase family protein [Sphingomicrobium sp.]
MRPSAGKAVILALFSISLAACERSSNSSNQAGTSESEAQLAWTKKTEKQLLEAIQQAPANGLKPDLFLKGDLPNDDSQRFAVLTQAALKYAEALAHGYSDPAKVNADYAVPRPSADVRQGLAQAIQNGNVDQWLASLPPQTDEYKALSQAHIHYVQLAGQTQFQPIPEGKPIKPGNHDPRVPALAAALKATGYLAAPAQPGAQQASDPHPVTERYSPDLVAAVKQVQAEFGMKTDGIVGGDTLDVLNLGPAGRARMLAVAMERLRWVTRDPPKTRIDVNTAATFLDYWRDGQHVDHRNVVSGEPDKQTPDIQAPFSSIVANPKWRVPDSIAEKELATKSQAWLAANDFVMENGKYVQQAGDKNSLGMVKFDMEDKQQIYMHDTPAKALFALPDRHRSHGCVRVENAVQFAEMLASQDGVQDQLEQALASGDEKWVKLKTEIPVRMFYRTAFWDGSRIQFRPDVYGRDNDVAAALGLVRGPAPKPYQPSGEELGP